MEAGRISRYLERINYTGAVAPTKEVLFSLHERHVFSVPFENIDIKNGNLVTTDPQVNFTKIVENRRGGYCFEVNSLFASLLEAIGFDVSYHGSRVWYGYDTKMGMRPRAHQILIISVDGDEYLVDVSFGNGMILPLLINSGDPQGQYGRTYRISADPVLGALVEQKVSGGWIPLFSFTREICYPSDYEVANYYACSNKNSLFTQKLICTMPDYECRRVSIDGEYSEVSNEGRHTLKIADEAHLVDLLLSKFDIDATEVCLPIFNRS